MQWSSSSISEEYIKAAFAKIRSCTTLKMAAVSDTKPLLHLSRYLFKVMLMLILLIKS
jgi:hypothetical protein